MECTALPTGLHTEQLPQHSVAVIACRFVQVRLAILPDCAELLSLLQYLQQQVNGVYSTAYWTTHRAAATPLVCCECVKLSSSAFVLLLIGLHFSLHKHLQQQCMECTALPTGLHIEQLPQHLGAVIVAPAQVCCLADCTALLSLLMNLWQHGKDITALLTGFYKGQLLARSVDNL